MGTSGAGAGSSLSAPSPAAWDSAEKISRRKSSITFHFIKSLLRQLFHHGILIPVRYVVDGESAVKAVQLNLGHIEQNHSILLLLLCGQQVKHSRFQSGKAFFCGGQLCLFFCFLAGLFLCSQLVGGVQHIPLHCHLFVIGILIRNSFDIHDFLYVFPPVWIFTDGLIVADLFHARHSIVMDGLGLGLEVAFRQVGGFDGAAVAVDNFHKFSFRLRHSEPDVRGVVGVEDVHRFTAASIRCRNLLLPSAISTRKIRCAITNFVISVVVMFVGSDFIHCLRMRRATARTPCRVGIACTHDKSAFNALPCAAVKLCRAGSVFADVQAAHGVVSLDYRCKDLLIDGIGIRANAVFEFS
nr:MAG TPA: hypothetical protein [Caudoviricetes sp.]